MQRAYAIYDRKAHVYSIPFFKQTDGEAVRMFMQASIDKNTNIFNYPSDYELQCVGEYQEDTGCFQNFAPTFLIRGDQAQQTFAKYEHERQRNFKYEEEEVEDEFEAF